MRIGGYDDHSPPPSYNGAGDVDSVKDIAARVNKSLEGYEQFLKGKTENPGPITEYALFVLGNYIIDYVPQEMPRYEKVLDGLKNKTKVRVDRVKKVLYERLEERMSKEPEEKLFPLGVGALL